MQHPLAGDEDGLGRKELNRLVARFEALGQTRLKRIRTTLTHEQRSFFDLLPLLWHVNHPTLPGFLSSTTPAGVIGFEPTREQLLLARRYVRGFKAERRRHRQAPILGLYLMGSMGSLGQTVGSDMDFWLCHSRDVDDSGKRRLRHKAALLEERAAETGLNAHFFLMHAESFRDGSVEELSKESSGHTQHTLLLEEFYRTGILLAGNPLLWWVVPPDREDSYTAYTQRLIAKRFIRPDHWLDFGGLQRLPPEEFFGVAHWQLFKGIDGPYKSLLKLMLLEAYASEYPVVDWLCMETKRAVYNRDGQPDADQLDPYTLILERITRYLIARSEPDRLQLARRAFYFKVGQALTRPNPNPDWRFRQMTVQAADWGWRDADLRLLDTRPEWKLERVVEERNALVSELSRSYRLLTEFAREQDAVANIDTHELALLGRKLYAALDKRPGKIDRVNPGISRDLSERALWLVRTSADPVRWQLYLDDPARPQQQPVKTSISLVEVLAWLHLNGICERSTQIHHLPEAGGYGESEPDRILRTLRKLLSQDTMGNDGLTAYASMARGSLSLWFINVGQNPLAHVDDAGYQLISERVDALSFGSAHDCLVTNIEHLYTTTWGEVRIERYPEGGDGLLDCLCRYLELFAPHEHRPGPIAAFSYSSVRGAAIAKRVSRLAREVAQCFHDLGESSRYLLRIADSFFQVHRREDRYAWVAIGTAAALEEHLAQPSTGFLPTRIDHLSLPESPLPTLLQHNQAGRVQVFYRLVERTVELFVFDEQGALFTQSIAGADEFHLLVQQQRFLDTVASRRLLASADSTADLTPHYARADHLRTGEWQITPVRVPRTRITDHVEIVLAVSPGYRLRDGFRLQFRNREFDSLLLGDRLYREAAQHIRELRRAGEDYPVYLTGVICAEGDTGGGCSLISLLRLKQELERHLAAAMD